MSCPCSICNFYRGGQLELCHKTGKIGGGELPRRGRCACAKGIKKRHSYGLAAIRERVLKLRDTNRLTFRKNLEKLFFQTFQCLYFLLHTDPEHLICPPQVAGNLVAISQCFGWNIYILQKKIGIFFLITTNFLHLGRTADVITDSRTIALDIIHRQCGVFRYPHAFSLLLVI